MSNYLIQGETLTNIADAIREKTGSTDQLSPSAMASAIAGIQAGGGVTVKSGTITFAERTGSYTFFDDSPSLFILYKEDNLKNTNTDAQGIWAVIAYINSSGGRVRYTFGMNDGSGKYFTPHFNSTSSAANPAVVLQSAFNGSLLPATYRYFGVYGVSI